MVDFIHLSSFILLPFVVLAAYLLGSIPSGVIVSRFFAQRDVRTIGSGHTGALNTFRAAGFTAALFAFVADGAKAIVAIYFARYVTQSDAIVLGFGLLHGNSEECTALNVITHIRGTAKNNHSVGNSHILGSA